MEHIVKGPNLKFSTETQEELFYNKETQLNNKAEGEAEITANIQAHHLYRCCPPARCAAL